MYIFLSILIAVVALLLIFIVMIQESKGGGLAAGFSSANNVIGVRRATNGVERTTWVLAGIMGFLCIVIAHWEPTRESSATQNGSSVITDYVDKATIPAATDAQPFGDGTTAIPTTETDNSTESSVPAEVPVATTPTE